MMRALSTADLWSDVLAVARRDFAHAVTSLLPISSPQSLMVTMACCSSRRGCARTVRYDAGRGSWGVSQLGLSLVDPQRSCYSPSDHSNMQRRCYGLLVGHCHQSYSCFEGRESSVIFSSCPPQGSRLSCFTTFIGAPECAPLYW